MIPIKYKQCACGQLYERISNKKINEADDMYRISHGIMCQYGLMLYIGSAADTKKVLEENPKLNKLELICNEKFKKILFTGDAKQ